MFIEIFFLNLIMFSCMKILAVLKSLVFLYYCTNLIIPDGCCPCSSCLPQVGITNLNKKNNENNLETNTLNSFIAQIGNNNKFINEKKVFNYKMDNNLKQSDEIRSDLNLTEMNSNEF